ncbi:unnamed protein product [Rhizophagus irregularis]|uniref:C2 domain-containing protein n=1 Tax=Rhizophagus irregularis TaxID=588596 RepID=A0A2N1P330_9GLOM|nr:hypothetical protein RhiirC2_724068 [Rhizophagus irregularis]CAB4377234.1 unnamed protein product [Rhizophagus irregularis]CAB5383327.1 unnamed protein product [Rhizophagus irregularis]
MSSDKSLRDENIKTDEFNYDKNLTYEIERIHRNSADSDRTLIIPYVSYSDLRDAFESSIYDKPEIRTCDCAAKLAKKKLENQSQVTQSEPNQSQQQEPQVYIILLFISIISYAIGYFGFTFVWLLIVLYQSVIWYMNMAKDNKERVRWEVEREMSIDKLLRDDGETVEWLNFLLQQIWRTFDPSLLIGLRDMLEDALARSAPSFVCATDIEAFEIGLIAPRIENIKILPRRENQDDEDVVVGEATFSFRARSSTMTRNDAPPHVLAWIKTGISAMVPLKVELIGFKASIHFEIKITGSSPFISTGKFSFLTPPLFDISIMPLVPMNIAQFPIIKDFIHTAVKYVMEQFTAPNFIELDLGQLLTGDDLLHDTQAIGIMRVDIIEARNLTHVDVSGDNDPYVISSLEPSPYMNTHSTTRVIEDCAKPVWKETFFHKIPELDIVDQHIKFKLGVMDWDRFTADDHIGSVWIDIKDAIGNGDEETLIHDGWEEIKLKPNDKNTRGELRYRLEYYPKLPIQDEPKLEQTSGIFGLKIHQAMNLQITTAPYIEESSIVMSDNHYNPSYPNPYAVVYLNDSRVFRTRAKLNNIAPFWNASTEQFVRDWRTAVVRVVVKDHKDLEYDPVIGMVTLPLKELFGQKEKKESNKWYPLRYGVGCGKVRLSFLFRTISMILPPEEKGYDVGTLFIHSIIAKELNNDHANRSVYLTLTIRNTEIEQETNVSNLHPPSWFEQRSKNDTKNRMEFAVFRRYRTSLIITVKRKGLFGIYQTVGMAEYWLTNIKDSCETEVEIPIFEILPKCFPPSDTDDADASQESNNFDNMNMVRCESPEPCDSSQREDGSQMIGESSLITKEKASEKVIENDHSTVGSTDISQPEEVGESSQSDEKIGQKDANNTESVSEDNKNEDLINKSSNKLPLESTEGSSEKSVLNTSTEKIPASNSLTEKSTTSIPASSEGVTNVPQESSTARENITSDVPKDNSTANSNSNEIKGFLNFKVYFRPGLSLSHEKDVMRSLTGADASILCQNPLEDTEEQRKVSREYVRRDSDVYRNRSLYGESYEPEKRINTIHNRRTMRQIQWVKDLLKAKVISMSGKRDWEDQEIIEHEA